ncbi:MAG: outer membrane lipoprotein-sorting protein [Gammaproteobacteria bacterium]
MKVKFLMVLFLNLVFNSLWAMTPEERGLEIANETDRRDTGFGDSTAKMTMILRSTDGEESVRHLEMKTFEVIGDGNRDLNIFFEPRDLRNTAVLTYSHGLVPDDQWIYLPALKRVKRISTQNKSGPFVGSELAFEDLSSWEVEKYSYRYLGDEVMDGHECFKVENIPQYEHSGYTRQVEWVDQEIYQPRRLDFYDRKNALLKTLTFHDYKQYLGQYWRPDRMLMVNHQTGKSTELLWDERQFRVGLNESDFVPNALRR